MNEDETNETKERKKNKFFIFTRELIHLWRMRAEKGPLIQKIKYEQTSQGHLIRGKKIMLLLR